MADHLKPISVTHLDNPFYVTDKIISCRRARINNVVIAAKASIGQMMLAQPTPHLFNGIKLRRIRWQFHNAHVADVLDQSGLIPASAIHDNYRMSPRFCSCRYLSKMACHDPLIYMGYYQCLRFSGRRAHRPKYVCVGRPAYSNCCCLTARGRLPLFAHNRVVVFCCPILASS
jgi:hypothetical protein